MLVDHQYFRMNRRSTLVGSSVRHNLHNDELYVLLSHIFLLLVVSLPGALFDLISDTNLFTLHHFFSIDHLHLVCCTFKMQGFLF